MRVRAHARLGTSPRTRQARTLVSPIALSAPSRRLSALQGPEYRQEPQGVRCRQAIPRAGRTASASRMICRTSMTATCELPGSYNSAPLELLGGEKDVVGGVGDAHFLVHVGFVAAAVWRFASPGVEPLDRSDLCQRAFATAMARDRDQQPRDGILVGRGVVGRSFPGDAAAVVGFPRRSAVMLAERLAVLVGKLRVDALQGPSKLCAIRLATVNLRSCGVDLRKKLFVGRWPQCLRRPLRARQETCSEEHREAGKGRDTLTHGGISSQRPHTGQERILLYPDFSACLDLLTTTEAKATIPAIQSRRTVRPGPARAPGRRVPETRGATTFPSSAWWQGP